MLHDLRRYESRERAHPLQRAARSFNIKELIATKMRYLV